jgi:23S rRNA pseudouridine2605 synthase
VGPAVVEGFRKGVELGDGRTQPARLTVHSAEPRRSTVEVELREGRKRQVRRMLAAFGHEVITLQRTRFGPVELAALAPGAWRRLRAGEVAALRRAAGLDDGTAETGAA